ARVSEAAQAPLSWVNATVNAAMSYGTSGAISGAGAGATAAAHLARSTLRSMMLMTTLKLTLPALALSGLLALGLSPLRDVIANVPLDELEPHATAQAPGEQATSTLKLTVV